MKLSLKSLFSPKETSFILWFIVIFLGSVGVLSVLGLLPNELSEQSGKTITERIAEDATKVLTGQSASQDGGPSANNSNASVGNTDSSADTSVKNSQIAEVKKLTQVGIPVHLTIPSINVDTQIIIPKNTSVSVLDDGLTKGPVYYPGSGTINSGNMFVFGHSTGYKVVLNKAYKVFNELMNLSEGDVIYVGSEGKTFLYKVKTVKKVDKDETLVTFDTKAHLLTLSTCNSFGAPSDRYVVVAEFAGEMR